MLPEIPFDLERDILDRMRQTQVTGKKHFIIIVSEGVVGAQELANQIQAATGVDSRATVLGHIQRGGSPTVRDRVNASLMGYHAIDLLDKGIYNRVVAVSGDKIVETQGHLVLADLDRADRSGECARRMKDHREKDEEKAHGAFMPPPPMNGPALIPKHEHPGRTTR